MDDNNMVIDAYVFMTRPSSSVIVKVDGSVGYETLFEFFHDEVTFTASEFIGKSVGDGRALFTRKDVAYLRS